MRTKKSCIIWIGALLFSACSLVPFHQASASAGAYECVDTARCKEEFDGIPLKDMNAGDMMAMMHNLLDVGTRHNAIDSALHTGDGQNIAGARNAGNLQAQNGFTKQHPATTAAVDYAVTQKHATRVYNVAESNKANMQLYAAADDLANAITYSIISEYADMPHDKAVAQLIAQGIDYGYINPTEDDVSDNGLHLISAAHAMGGGQNPNYIWAMGASMRGVPVDCTGIKGKHGATFPSGKLPVAQDRCRGNFFGAMWEAIGTIEPNPYCHASPDCGARYQKHAASVRLAGAKVNRIAHMTFANATMNNQNTSADNNGIGSFFISSAYAYAGVNTTSPTDGAAQNFQQACQNAVTKGKQVDRLTTVGQCASPVQAALSAPLEKADSMTGLTNDLKNGEKYDGLTDKQDRAASIIGGSNVGKESVDIE